MAWSDAARAAALAARRAHSAQKVSRSMNDRVRLEANHSLAPAATRANMNVTQYVAHRKAQDRQGTNNLLAAHRQIQALAAKLRRK